MSTTEASGSGGAGPPVGRRSLRAHVVGVGERGMPGLAHLLLHSGAEVRASSSPAEETPGRRLGPIGLRIDAGHRAFSGPRPPHCLVFAPETPPTHPDRLRASRLGIAQRGLGDVLDELLADCPTRVLCVSRGGRPRSTAARLGLALARLGVDPKILLSTSASNDLKGWARMGSGGTAVVEALPSASGWLPSGPTALILHGGADRGGWSAVEPVVSSLRPTEPLLASRSLLETAPTWLTDHSGLSSFGLRRGCRWRASDLKDRGDQTRFRVFRDRAFVAELEIEGTTSRGVLEALAASAMATELGVSPRDLRGAFEGFGGLERQAERLGRYRGVAVVDDRAEYPRFAEEAWSRCRKWLPGSKVVVLVQGVEAPAGADRVLRLPPGPKPDDLARAVERLDELLESGDVLLTLGESSVRDVADAFLRRRARPGQAG